MRNVYYVLNVMFLTVLLLTSAQSNQPKGEKQPPVVQEKVNYSKKTRDSLLKIVNDKVDESIQFSEKAAEKRGNELVKSKEAEQKALNGFIQAVDKYVSLTGREVVTRTSLSQKLKSGEVFLNKDSVCVETKRRFLGKAKCVKWQYSWYLIDKEGNIEKL